MLVLLPKLRPQPWILQNFARNRRECVALFHHTNFEFFRIRRILIRADVTIRPYCQIPRRGSLLRNGLGRSLLRKNRRSHEHGSQYDSHTSAITSRCASVGQLNVARLDFTHVEPAKNAIMSLQGAIIFEHAHG